MNVETTIKLNKFVPRDYQLPVFKAFDSGKYNKFLIVNPRRCLSGDSHITMADGSFKYLRDIRVGDELLSWDGTKYVKDVVKNFWSTGIKTTMRVKTPINPALICSSDHQFANTCCGGAKVQWTKIGEMGKHRHLLQYSGVQTSSESNVGMAELWGYLLSDGYVCGYQQPKFTNTNEEILRRVEELLRSLFYDINVIWRPKGNGFDLGISNGTKGGGTFKNPVKEMFRAYGADVPKYQRRLPDIIWQYDRKALGRFFAAIISSDGNIYSSSRIFINKAGKSVPPSNEITISCGSNDLYAWDIYWLLRKMGLIPQMPYKEKESNWKVRVGKGKDIEFLLSFGPIYGKESAQKKMLNAVANTKKSNSRFAQCYRSGYEVEEDGLDELFDIETGTNHNFFANGYLVHNSGKDYEWTWIILRELLQHVGLYLYCLPTFSQARSVIWEGKANDGSNFLDMFPKELITRVRNDSMTINFTNGSILRLVGSDNYDRSIVGSNPRMIVFSEYALCDENAYKLAALPIIKANGGKVALISTPRGKNHMYELYQIAVNSPDWYTQFLTVDDTGHISREEIQKEIASGEISESLALQEYWCSFAHGDEHSYYAKYINTMRLKGRITTVDWEPYHKVYTAWDLGLKDLTVIIFFQVFGDSVKIFDYYENSDKPIPHYASVIKAKADDGYLFERHFGPHDLMQRESARGLSKKELYAEAGVKFSEPIYIEIEDGIELVRKTLGKIWIDEKRCAKLIKALENYSEEYDSKRKMYRGRPKHDVNSHAADAFRYLCAALPKTKPTGDAAALEKRYAEAMGHQPNMPAIFRTDFNEY